MTSLKVALFPLIAVVLLSILVFRVVREQRLPPEDRPPFARSEVARLLWGVAGLGIAVIGISFLNY